MQEEERQSENKMKVVFFFQRPGLKLLWYTSVPVYLCCLGRQWMHLLPVVCQTKDLEITAPRGSLCQWWRAHWDVSPEQEIDIFLNCVMQDWLLYMNSLYLCCWTTKANQRRWQSPSKVTYVEIQKQFSGTRLLYYQIGIPGFKSMCLKTGHTLGIDSILVFSGIWPLCSIRIWDNSCVVLFLSYEQHRQNVCLIVTV